MQIRNLIESEYYVDSFFEVTKIENGKIVEMLLKKNNFTLNENYGLLEYRQQFPVVIDKELFNYYEQSKSSNSSTI